MGAAVGDAVAGAWPLLLSAVGNGGTKLAKMFRIEFFKTSGLARPGSEMAKFKTSQSASDACVDCKQQTATVIRMKTLFIFETLSY